jgi:hypothetical protein
MYCIKLTTVLYKVILFIINKIINKELKNGRFVSKSLPINHVTYRTQ